jgi:protein phosphatase
MSVTTPRDATWRPALAGVIGVPDASALRSEPITRHAEIATRWTRLDAAVATSPGGRHAVNEDCHSALDCAVPLFVVADGVGGGALASRASRELVARLHDALERAGTHPETIRTALLDADYAVRRSIASDTDRSGAATVALCKATGTSLAHWVVAWVGDCRVYRVPAGDRGAELLTVDDTYRHLREEPPYGGSLDDPARMVGNGAIDRPNVRRVVLRAGEMLVLCSDGVHKHADPIDIARVLRASVPLARRCMRLIEFARASGSRDDATVLVVHRTKRDGKRFARAMTMAVAAALIAAGLWWFGVDPATGQAVREWALVDVPQEEASP